MYGSEERAAVPQAAIAKKEIKVEVTAHSKDMFIGYPLLRLHLKSDYFILKIEAYTNIKTSYQANILCTQEFPLASVIAAKWLMVKLECSKPQVV